MTGILITLEQNLNWMKLFQKFETEVRADANGENYQKPRW